MSSRRECCATVRSDLQQRRQSREPGAMSSRDRPDSGTEDAPQRGLAGACTVSHLRGDYIGPSPGPSRPDARLLVCRACLSTSSRRPERESLSSPLTNSQRFQLPVQPLPTDASKMRRATPGCAAITASYRRHRRVACHVPYGILNGHMIQVPTDGFVLSHVAERLTFMVGRTRYGGIFARGASTSSWEMTTSLTMCDTTPSKQQSQASSAAPLCSCSCSSGRSACIRVALARAKWQPARSGPTTDDPHRGRPAQRDS
jgi:hypothetical protein